MQLTWISFAIACPALFLAGLLNAIGGGGALISLPAYILAGLPAHSAVATNKLSSSCGATVSTVKFLKEHLIDIKLAIPAVITAIISSAIGAKISLFIPEKILTGAMIVILPLVSIIVLRPSFSVDENDKQIEYDLKTYGTVIMASLLIGFYDGVYGPGTGTFLIIAFRMIAKIDVNHANGLSKIINWTTDISALAVFLFHSQIVFIVGIPCAICNMLGSYIGARLAIRNGIKIIKPCIIIMLTLLMIKVVCVVCG